MENVLLVILVVIVLFYINYYINRVTEFDVKIKEIEDILDSSEARSRKYELFDMLGKLSDNCSNYNELSTMNELLGRVYAL